MSAAAWHAAGVRHELLLRALPALRHDLAGPLSVARMGTTIVRRYLAADPPNLAASGERLVQTEEQMALLVAAIRALGRWDDAAGEPEAAGPAVCEALEIARPTLDLHGVRLEAEGIAVPAAWPAVRPGRALYATLGALACLQDAERGAARLAVQAASDTLRFTRVPAADRHAVGDELPRRPRAIAPGDLQALADELRWPMDIGTASVLLKTPAA